MARTWLPLDRCRGAPWPPVTSSCLPALFILTHRTISVSERTNNSVLSSNLPQQDNFVVIREAQLSRTSHVPNILLSHNCTIKHVKYTEDITHYRLRPSNLGNMNCKENGHGVLVIQKPKPNPPPSNPRYQ